MLQSFSALGRIGFWRFPSRALTEEMRGLCPVFRNAAAAANWLKSFTPAAALADNRQQICKQPVCSAA